MPANIVPDLQALTVPASNVVLMADNARIGDVARVAASLNAFGQRKPIVCKRTGQDTQGRPTGIVIAGNHTFRAATEELGWDSVAAVWVEDDDTTAKAYALADNRTGEVATWDLQQLSTDLAELAASEWDMSNLGWKPHELEPLLAAEWSPGSAEGDLGDFSNQSHKSDHALTMHFDEAQAATIKAAIAQVRAGSDEQVSDAEALAAICGGYTEELQA